MTFYKKHVLTCSIYGADAYFDVDVYAEWVECSAMELDPMCDAYNIYRFKGDNVYVVVTPTDKMHNTDADYESLEVKLPNEIGRKVIVAILNDDCDLLWYTKDRLRYAKKYGKVI